MMNSNEQENIVERTYDMPEEGVDSMGEGIFNNDAVFILYLLNILIWIKFVHNIIYLHIVMCYFYFLNL